MAEIRPFRGLRFTEKAGEIVHHKDGNILNNDPVNLEVLSSQSEHCRVHGFGKKKGGGVDEHFQ